MNTAAAIAISWLIFYMWWKTMSALRSWVLVALNHYASRTEVLADHSPITGDKP